MRRMLEKYERLSIAELEALVRRHNRLYFVEGRPEISDAEFDGLVEILRKKSPDSPALQEIVSDVTSSEKKVRHERPMLSLDKCYDEQALRDWAEKFEGDIVAMPKIDGCAVSVRYDEHGRLKLAATRGSGVEGEEITANVRMIPAIPQQIALGAVEVRGEIFMPRSVFERFRGQFANPRNLTAGVIKLKDAAKTADYALAFFAFDLLGSKATTEMEKRKLLEKSGFPVVQTWKLSRDDMQRCYEDVRAKRDSYDFETDGVVFRADRIDEQARLGATGHHPRYAIAYKFQGDSGTTTLIDVEWSVARTGVITPVGIVEPVELSGAMVRRASLHNVGLMEKLKVTKGATVLMMRRGGVIPNLEAVLRPGAEPIALPTQCPSCGSPTKRRDDFLYCTRPKGCARSKVGELAHFVKTAEIDGFGTKLLEQLYDQGIVTDPSEFYELTMDDLMGLTRMGETLATKLLRNIDRRRELPLAVFLQGLGIRELGRHTAELLEPFEDLDRILALTEDELAALHGIGPIIAREVATGLKKKARLIERLRRHITIIARPRSHVKAGPLAGKSVLFTGALEAMDRKAAQRLVEEAGGIVASSVNKALDILVVGAGGGAGSKLAKARELAAGGGKVQIVSEAEFWGMVKKRM